MKLVVANLKLNLTLPEIVVYKNKIEQILTGNSEVVICPSFPYLSLLKGNNYSLGAQNVSDYLQGSFTGEVGARDLASLDVDYVIVAHSERRLIFKESASSFATKINNIIENGMRPVFCIGEIKEERNKKKRMTILDQQLTAVLNKVSSSKLNKVIIAYEPVWSTGSGKFPLVSDIEETVEYIKNSMKRYYRADVKVLYGGSIGEFNIRDLNNIKSCDGYIIGSACLNIEEFKTILQTIV